MKAKDENHKANFPMNPKRKMFWVKKKINHTLIVLKGQHNKKFIPKHKNKRKLQIKLSMN